MLCQKCDYRMEVFDEECPKCRGRGVTSNTPEVPKSDASRNALKWIIISTFSLLLIWPCYIAWVKAYAYTQHDAVLEVVVRKHLSPSSSGVLFVAFNGQDPGDSFIGRFKDSPVVVRKGSQAIQKKGPPSDAWSIYHVDAVTGQRGAYIDIDNVTWLGPFKAQVEVSYPALGNRFTVERTSQGWIITDEDLAWIS